ncbi:unnamed protein product [Echinostoma caproni]|uniref:Uncharacterized protein n=1 Tax=Echinostoma caproni TaxID=27848 RepID=A0A183A669_9TREM|nr:unnamed protein product [Echinostoma caproni]
MDASRLLYASHVRPRLEYSGAATYHCTTGKLAKLKRVQRAATRLVVGLRGTSYEGRLQATDLFPIAYRRLKGDLICLRKILRGDKGPEL